ncbi:polyphosphate kinase 1 [Amphibiibacter pelophylacis]|uniref:Polyphosphate kinase 1 n=1 Tax=Amphibiibacter pelophylacis TaxID=1799477 RepID=A0ACC6P4E3_9BURK
MSSASAPRKKPRQTPSAPGLPGWIPRDASILSFNARVLQRAQDPAVPPLERLRYLTIVSSNLDEFFEVRMVDHLQAHLDGETRPGPCSPASYAALSAQAHELVARQYDILTRELEPLLRSRGIHFLSGAERNAAQNQWLRHYFEREVRPLLLPIGLDPAHPFPQVASKSLNFMVRLEGRDAFGRSNQVAIVRIPRALPRLIRLPARLASRPGEIPLVSLSSLIRGNLQSLFAGRRVEEISQFRVTRNSDIDMTDVDVSNLRLALRESLKHRHYGRAVRIEVSANCTDTNALFLCEQFGLDQQALYRVNGPVNLVRLGMVMDLVDRPDLLFPPFQPRPAPGLKAGQSFFERLQKGDVLAHQPFESFDAVIDFLREAVHDPDVVAIKQTIYRTESGSQLVRLLGEAVRKGKDVTALVELQARFDEEANINWAESLEAVGVQVVYGVVGLKTHGKMLLVTRREGRRLRRYGHLSTGNYNARSARLYTDFSHFTADPVLTLDMHKIFVHLASQTELPRLGKIWLAPSGLQSRLLARMAAAARAARAGKPARLVAKMNAFTDEALLEAIVAASQAGVQIELIVRGACMLPAQLAGVTDNVRVRSVIGRFLEHTRIVHFDIAGRQELLLSSADWMSRNMLRRIELAWPVEDPALVRRILREGLGYYLEDRALSWTLRDSQYLPPAPVPGQPSVHDRLMAGHSEGAPQPAGAAGRSVSL